MKKYYDVFIPGSLPESTYITRTMSSGFTYEERLRQALSVSGYLTLISGPSKIGKTVLCEKVIGIDRIVEISGSDMMNPEDLWIQIGTKAGMPHSGTTKSGKHIEELLNAGSASEYEAAIEKLIDCLITQGKTDEADGLRDVAALRTNLFSNRSSVDNLPVKKAAVRSFVKILTNDESKSTTENIVFTVLY